MKDTNKKVRCVYQDAKLSKSLQFIQRREHIKNRDELVSLFGPFFQVALIKEMN